MAKKYFYVKFQSLRFHLSAKIELFFEIIFYLASICINVFKPQVLIADNAKGKLFQTILSKQ